MALPSTNKCRIGKAKHRDFRRARDLQTDNLIYLWHFSLIGKLRPKEV